MKCTGYDQAGIRSLIPAIEATRAALWNETKLEVPEIYDAVRERVYLADNRLHRGPHEDVVSPGQARNLRLDLADSNGSEIRRGFIRLEEATMLNGGLTVHVFSTSGNEAAELSLGPGIHKLGVTVDGKVSSALKSPTRLAEATTLLNVSQYNYFHFLAQALPSLARIQSRIPPSIPVILGGEFATGNSFGAQLVRCLFPELKVKFLSVGDSLYVDSMNGIPPTTTNIFEPAGLELVRERGRSLVAESKSMRGPRVVFLARGDQERNRRKLLNQAQVIELLRKKWPDIVVIVAGLMTIEEQMNTLVDAQVIIGLHGAQMTNMMWAPPTASVIEIVPDHMDTSDLLSALGKALGLNYWLAKSTGANNSHWSVADQVADLDDLSRTLSQIS